MRAAVVRCLKLGMDSLDLRSESSEIGWPPRSDHQWSAERLSDFLVVLVIQIIGVFCAASGVQRTR